MNTVFRVDASNLIGTGHLMRCLTLAEALRDRGAQPRFICRSHPGNLIALLQQRAFPVSVLRRTPFVEPRQSADYASWLGVTQDQDATETIRALGRDRSDWLVVDHYGLDRVWEQRLRPYARRLMVIDDLANRDHDCDLLLDQNFTENAQTRYQELVPPGCRMLIGPHYALLRPEYAMWRKETVERNGNVRRILVFMGGYDLHNMTGLVLRILSEPEFKELKVDVVVGANNSHLSGIRSQANNLPQVTLHEQRPHLADLMAKADLAIGTGGATTWERLCLCLPALVVSVAENQESACKTLERAGLIHYAGKSEMLDEQSLLRLITKMISERETLRRLSIAARNLLDGQGTARVSRVIKDCLERC